ncbi:hypothetical protein BV25DRAFT_1843123 [Artomyces pyxidatus]|uniref:Uncharacterized protein n=1 Tax=Artomyces pyxidatus TaxID=48021 RepID=A0ACB8SFQ6_9AGAM|nr:hypothetical protein BV25DRAFT_1843123 [Artomyces pyxidatus]
MSNPRTPRASEGDTSVQDPIFPTPFRLSAPPTTPISDPVDFRTPHRQRSSTAQSTTSLLLKEAQARDLKPSAIAVTQLMTYYTIPEDGEPSVKQRSQEYWERNYTAEEVDDRGPTAWASNKRFHAKPSASWPLRRVIEEVQSILNDLAFLLQPRRAPYVIDRAGRLRVALDGSKAMAEVLMAWSTLILQPKNSRGRLGNGGQTEGEHTSTQTQAEDVTVDETLQPPSAHEFEQGANRRPRSSMSNRLAPWNTGETGQRDADTSIEEVEDEYVSFQRKQSENNRGILPTPVTVRLQKQRISLPGQAAVGISVAAVPGNILQQNGPSYDLWLDSGTDITLLSKRFHRSQENERRRVASSETGRLSREVHSRQESPKKESQETCDESSSCRRTASSSSYRYSHPSKFLKERPD